MAKSARKKTSAKKTDSSKIIICDTKGKEIGKADLDVKVFDGKVNMSLLHQATVAYLANQRKGLSSAKTRAEVSGGGIKPWRQKGTGRARVGSIRSPLWRKGGITFGPKPHSYYTNFPKKMKAVALKSALNAKLKDEEIVIIDKLKLDSCKTKEFYKIIQNLKLDGQRIQLVVEGIDNNLKLATRNIPRLSVTKATDVHATEIINSKKLILTKDALKQIEERVIKCLQ
jgi:large subunit ribosomal protein L4